MKKKAVLLLSLVLCAMFAFAGCGNKSNAGGANGGNNSSKTENKKDEAKENKKDENKKDEEKGQEQAASKTTATELIAAEDPSKLPEGAKARKDTLIVGFTAPDGRFSPIYYSSVYDGQVCTLIFGEAGLVSTDAKGLPIPEMAERWEVSEDGKTYTFYIKKGIKYSNGEEVTAEDFAFTYTSMCDPTYDGSRMESVQDLVGYKEYNEGDATEVAGIKVIDDYTISFTLSKVKAPAIYDFAYQPLCKSYYNFEKGDFEAHKQKLLEPMGAGPYTLKNYVAGQSVEFTANPGYYKGEPKTKNVICKVTTAETQIQELVTGGVDVQRVSAKPQNINKLKKEGFIGLQLYADNGYGYIGVNHRSPKFSDKRVRQALTYGLNREGFVNLYFKGYASVCNVPISPVSWAYTEDINKYEFNPEKAKQLLDEAGWKMADDGWRYKDGEKFTISWMTYTGSKYVETLIPIVQNNYKELGIEVIPELMEFATLCTKVYDEQKFEMYNMAWSLSVDPDSIGLFGKEAAELGGNNSVGWVNEKSIELMEKGIAETDQAKRADVYKEWAKVCNEELPYIFLDTSKQMYAVSSKVKGINCSSYIGWTHDIHLVELDK